ncbi:hypothetical protein BpHYR1_053619 [Brachionus plicatilis]|uniref:Uncharacterized protein n=1 Tax=Brachionus plicatilis TaxID=10195 RepID=A0A3M7PHF0_BRAPC|nr:hypothetical protein BpHYR1_053619 [Brachionus plicatilis]
MGFELKITQGRYSLVHPLHYRIYFIRNYEFYKNFKTILKLVRHNSNIFWADCMRLKCAADSWLLLYVVQCSKDFSPERNLHGTKIACTERLDFSTGRQS